MALTDHRPDNGVMFKHAVKPNHSLNEANFNHTMKPTSPQTEAMMITILLIGAAGAAWFSYRKLRKALATMPRANDDVVFF
jgi:hypothetical protein